MSDGPQGPRGAYPSDVSDDEWAFCCPYLALVRADAPQRVHDLRGVFHAVRWVVRTGSPWRYVPHDLPPWAVVYQQAQRWIAADVFEAMAHDLRALLRVAAGRAARPTAAAFDGRTIQSTRESGAAGRAGYDGHKKKKGSKVHMAVDTLGPLLAAHEQERAQVATLAERVQAATGGSVRVAFVDQGYTGPDAAEDAEGHGIRLEVVKHTAAKKGFVLLPRRWVVERSFAWAARFRRLARDYERLPGTLAGIHFVAFVCLMLRRLSS